MLRSDCTNGNVTCSVSVVKSPDAILHVLLLGDVTCFNRNPLEFKLAIQRCNLFVVLCLCQCFFSDFQRCVFFFVLMTYSVSLLCVCVCVCLSLFMAKTYKFKFNPFKNDSNHCRCIATQISNVSFCYVDSNGIAGLRQI